MTAPLHDDVTRLLGRAQAGDVAAADRLMPFVYDELRRLAQDMLQHERPGHTLQATALVHEAYLRLVDQTRTPLEGRAHFFAMAATMIRRILVDHARAHQAVKRGGGAERIPLHETLSLVDTGAAPLDLLAVHDAMETLERSYERQARVAELRFFGGLGVEETAEVLGVSARTVKDDWRFARAWLRTRLLNGDRQ